MATNRSPSSGYVFSPRFLLIGLGAFLLFLGGALATWRVVARLPALQMEALAARDLNGAIRNAYRAAPASAAAGIRVMESSEDVTAALFGRRSIDEAARRCAQRAQMTTNTQLPRLQQAALALLALDRLSAPPDQQWRAMEPYVGGLGEVSFAHYQRDALDVLAGAAVACGATPGVAADFAVMRFGTPHGPFLQYFAERLTALSAALSQAEGTAAAGARCRQIARRLLKQWVLEPAPAGLRLLAADLLIRDLQNDAQVDVSTARIVTDLTQWAQACRNEMRRRPTGQLDLRRQPVAAVQEYRVFRNYLAMTAWCGGAAAAAMLLLLGSCWTALGRDRPEPAVASRAMALGCAGGGFIVICALAILLRADDLLADFSWAWPRLPMYAAGMTLVMAGLAAFVLMDSRLGATPRWRLAGVYIGVSCAALLLAGALLCFALLAAGSQQAYDAATALALRDEIAFLAGAGADSFLVSLRAWSP